MEETPRTPVYLAESQFHDYASDLWMIKEDSVIYDFSIGRLPANSESELSAAINKIITYETEIVDQYNNQISFVYDVDPISNFEEATMSYSARATLFQNSFVDIDSAGSSALIDQFSDHFLVNYMGHGSEYQLGKVHLDVSEVTSMTNEKWPILVGLNCLTTYYASPDPADKGLGEALVLQENAGAIGIIAANTLLSPIDQSTFATYFYDEMNRTAQSANQNTRLGDVLMNTHSRLLSAGLDTRQTDSILLLGDPSLRLPPTIFQGSAPLLGIGGESTSTGGCTLGQADIPWYLGLLEILCLIGLYYVFRRFTLKKI